MGRKAEIKSKHYLSNKDLYCEMIVSKEMGKLTKQAEKMLILLTKNVVKKMIYLNHDDRLDCLQTAYVSVFSNWHNFDEQKGDNPFSYFTEVIKRGLALGWNNLYKLRGDDDKTVKVLSLDGYNEDGERYDRF